MGGQCSPASTHFELCRSILFSVVIITGLTGVPLFLFLLTARLCPVSFIVAGPEPIEDIVGRDEKVREDCQERSQITHQGASVSEVMRGRAQ